MIQETVYVPVIRTPADHRVAVAQLEDLVKADRPNDTAKMDALALLIEDYERKAFPIPELSPIEAVKHSMAIRELSQADLARSLKIGRGRISEILQGQRGMSLSMIRALHVVLDIPVSTLIGTDEQPHNGNARHDRSQSSLRTG